MNKNMKKYFPVFVLPTLLAFTIGFIIPFGMGMYLSFCEFTTVVDAKFVGLSNYIRFFQDPDFLHSLWFTAAFAVISSVLINVFGFVVALFMVRGIRGTNIFRTVFFMPNLIGGIVLGWIWQIIFNGILQQYERTLTYSAAYGFWGLMILMCWQNIGYMMIIYIAGLQSIPKELMESAQMDGAGPWKTLIKIKLPMVMPSITICTFLTLTSGFKLFDQNLSLTNGQPGKQTEMLALNIYNTFYGRRGWEGVGQAEAVIFFILVAAIAIMQLKITRPREVQQ